MEVWLKSPCSYCGSQTHFHRGKWSEEEDQRLLEAIYSLGECDWKYMPSNAGIERCGLSLKNRWYYHLRPGIVRGPFSEEEEERLIKLHSIHGKKWATISKMMPGRTTKWVRCRCLTAKVRRRLELGAAGVGHENQEHQVQEVKQPAEVNLELTLRPPSADRHVAAVAHLHSDRCDGAAEEAA